MTDRDVVREYTAALRENSCGDWTCYDARLDAALLVLKGGATHRQYADIVLTAAARSEPEHARLLEVYELASQWLVCDERDSDGRPCNHVIVNGECGDHGRNGGLALSAIRPALPEPEPTAREDAKPNERERAIDLANRTLDTADRGMYDPDGDLAVLSRQLLRAVASSRPAAPEPEPTAADDAMDAAIRALPGALTARIDAEPVRIVPPRDPGQRRPWRREPGDDLSDSQRLLLLAAWFDMWDRPETERQAILDDPRNPGRNDVQRDLVRIADTLDALARALPAWLESGDDGLVAEAHLADVAVGWLATRPEGAPPFRYRGPRG